MTIQFGTDGWRALIADTYTFENVRIVAQATAQFWKSEARKKLECYAWPRDGSYACTYRGAEQGMVVGYDARFLSEEFAREAAKVISANGIPVFLSKSLSPTPTISYAVFERKLSGGIMITASHNAYAWNGFKIKMEFGGSSLPEITRGVEEEVEKIQRLNLPILTQPCAPLKDADLIEPYFDAIRKKVNFSLFEKRPLKIIVDPLYGTNVGLIKKLLPHFEIVELHVERNPFFGGLNPEPIVPNLKELLQAVVREKAACGLAFDGDGDRIGAVDEKGNFLSSHEIFSLLLWHLAKHRKWTGGVAKTFSTTNRVKLLAEHFKLPFHETPIGFKHIAKLFLTQDILIGGEESGGIGIKNHIPERDSLLNALLLLELMMTTGKKLGETLQEIHHITGFYYNDRIDLELSPDEKERVMPKLLRDVPDDVGGLKVEGTSNLDGVKYLLKGNAWILFRASGTEPLIRIYAEAESQFRVEKLLQRGKEILKESAHAGVAKN